MMSHHNLLLKILQLPHNQPNITALFTPLLTLYETKYSNTPLSNLCFKHFYQTKNLQIF